MTAAMLLLPLALLGGPPSPCVPAIAPFPLGAPSVCRLHVVYLGPFQCGAWPTWEASDGVELRFFGREPWPEVKPPRGAMVEAHLPGGGPGDFTITAVLPGGERAWAAVAVDEYGGCEVLGGVR